MNQIEKLLQKGRKLREQGKPWLALPVFGQALSLAQKAKQYEKAVEVLGDRAITWRHLFDETSDPQFAVFARKDAETMMELVKLWGVEQKLHTAYYMLGQAALLFHEYEQAENFFFKALRYFKGNKAEKGSWKYHWAKALYMLGQKKKALLAFAASVNEIKKNALPKESFLTNVYLSGAYMNFSFVLAKDGKLEDGRRYFDLAKDLVSKDKRLVVRREQLKKLAEHFTQEGLRIQ